MNKFLYFLFCTCYVWVDSGGGQTELYSEQFKENAFAGVYKDSIVRSNWKNWLDQKDLLLECPDKGNCNPKAILIHKNVHELLGKELTVNFAQCVWVFPPKKKTLKEICTLLRGFYKLNFFHGEYKTFAVFVRIEFKNYKISFRMQPTGSKGGRQFYFLFDAPYGKAPYHKITEQLDSAVMDSKKTPNIQDFAMFKEVPGRLESMLETTTETMKKWDNLGYERVFEPALVMHILVWVAETVTPQDADIEKYKQFFSRVGLNATKNKPADVYVTTALAHQSGRTPEVDILYMEKMSWFFKNRTNPTFTLFMRHCLLNGRELPFYADGGTRRQRFAMLNSYTGYKFSEDEGKKLVVYKNEKVTTPMQKIAKSLVKNDVPARGTRSQVGACNFRRSNRLLKLVHVLSKRKKRN